MEGARSGGEDAERRNAAAKMLGWRLPAALRRFPKRWRVPSIFAISPHSPPPPPPPRLHCGGVGWGGGGGGGETVAVG
jgi:hypothetical protein